MTLDQTVVLRSSAPSRNAKPTTTTRSESKQHVNSPKSPWTWPLAALLVFAQATVVFDIDLPVVRPLAAGVSLLGLPTLVLYRRAGFAADTAVARVLYAFGASVLGVVLVGLLVNTVLPLVGDDHPLGPAVLGIAFLCADAGLLAWRRSVPLLDRGPSEPYRQRLGRLLALRWETAQLLAVLAVVAAVLGAVRLNNGSGGLVAWVAHVLAAAALVVLLVGRSRTDVRRDAIVLVLVAVTLLLATSLRGWGITGHDIQAEYYAFSLTDGAHHWSTGLLDNAYNACLSVTVLPAVLAQTTGLSGVVVFKLVLQLGFALVPLMTFLVSRRFLDRRLALVASTFTMAFPTFFTDMPYLVRQEVAFFFLALMLLAATEPGGTPKQLRWLVGFFGVGVVLSHYSTTYLLVLALVIGLILHPVLRLWGRKHEAEAGVERRPLVLLSPVLVAFLAIASVLWVGPVTHTGGHAADVARDTIATILGQRDGGPGSSDVNYSLFSRHDPGPRSRLNHFVDDTLDLRKQAPASILLVKNPGPEELRPPIVEASTMPLTPVGHALDAVGISAESVTNVAKLGCAALMQLFLMIGVFRLLVRGRRGSHRKLEARLSPELTCVVLGVMAALGLVVVVPSLSVEYGVLRAFQQSLLIVAPVMAAGMWTLLKLFGRRAAMLAVVVPVGLLLVLSGVASSLLGGHQARLALANSGLYYDRYISADSDVTSMSWLSSAEDNDGSAPKVITGRNDVLPTVTAGLSPADVVDRIYPTLLTKGSYVFVDSRMAKTHKSTIFYSGDRISYHYPMENLDRLLDLVYSSGRSKVYR